MKAADALGNEGAQVAYRFKVVKAGSKAHGKKHHKGHKKGHKQG